MILVETAFYPRTSIQYTLYHSAHSKKEREEGWLWLVRLENDIFSHFRFLRVLTQKGEGGRWGKPVKMGGGGKGGGVGGKKGGDSRRIRGQEQRVENIYILVGHFVL